MYFIKIFFFIIIFLQVTKQDYGGNGFGSYIPEYSEIYNFHVDKTIILNNNVRLFSSACIQCLLCQTVAGEYEKILSFYHNTQSRRKYTRSFCLRKSFVEPLKFTILNSAKFNQSLEMFCDAAFINFDLRDNKGLHLLERKSKKTKQVSHGVDGLWPKKLQEMCKIFMNYRGEWYLYLRWIKEVQKPNFQITNFLCRSHGIFQYCRNLDISTKIINKCSHSNFFY